MSATPSESAAANRMPMAVSSFRLPPREIKPIPSGDSAGGCDGADQQAAVQDVGDGDARQDGMRHGISQEGHPAQHDVRAHHRAQDSHHHGGSQSALHECVGQRLKQPLNHDAPRWRVARAGGHRRAGSIRPPAWLPFSMTNNELPKAWERFSCRMTSPGGPKAMTRLFNKRM